MPTEKAHELTTLVIARHSLICRAAELDQDLQEATAHYDALPVDRREHGLEKALESMIGELLVLPRALEELEERIAATWNRLLSMRSR